MQKTPSVNMLGLAIVLVAIFLGAVLFSKTEKVETVSTEIQQPKVKSSILTDGEYVVQINAVNQTVEDTIIAMRHVAYFEGPEARIAAAKEIECDGQIEECVPTLESGYYVRQSNNAPFEVPVPAGKVALATMMLNAIRTNPDVVFNVAIVDGQLSAVEQKTK